MVIGMTFLKFPRALSVMLYSLVLVYSLEMEKITSPESCSVALDIS